MIALDLDKARDGFKAEMLEKHPELGSSDVGRLVGQAERMIENLATATGRAVSSEQRFAAMANHVKQECERLAEARRTEPTPQPPKWRNPEPEPLPWWSIQLPRLFDDAFSEQRDIMRRQAGISGDMDTERTVAWVLEHERTQSRSGDALWLYFPTPEDYVWDGKWPTYHAGTGPTDAVLAFSGDGPEPQPLYAVARTVASMMRAIDCSPLVAWRYLIEGRIDPIPHMRVSIHRIPEPVITLTVRSAAVPVEEVERQYAAAAELARHHSRLKSYRDDTVTMYEQVREMRAAGQKWGEIAKSLGRAEAGLRNQYNKMRREIEGSGNDG